MIKMNRTTEYGLIALRHMSRKADESSAGAVTSAREVADTYGFPFEITAKTLQRLKDVGLIGSEQGARGGYALKRTLQEITLAEFLDLMEGPQAVVACTSLEADPKVLAKSGCEYGGRCEVKHVMTGLNERLKSFLNSIRLSELAAHSAGIHGSTGGSRVSILPMSAMSGEEP